MHAIIACASTILQILQCFHNNFGWVTVTIHHNTCGQAAFLSLGFFCALVRRTCEKNFHKILKPHACTLLSQIKLIFDSKSFYRTTYCTYHTLYPLLLPQFYFIPILIIYIIVKKFGEHGLNHKVGELNIYLRNIKPGY